MRARLNGEEILQIADADSGGWEGLVAVTLDLKKQEPEIREDFNVQDCVLGFGFLYQACFHPSLRPWQTFIIDAVCRTFPAEALIFTLDKQTDLTPTERASLGFRKVAQTDYQFRPNMLKTEFDPSDVAEDIDSVVIPANAADYVNKHWSE